MTGIPKIKLNNGFEIPALGLGTWQGEPGKEDEVYQAVKDAIDIGYRLFDCANFYNNEKSIGRAIHQKISEGVIKREDVFIVSKLWCNNHQPDSVEPALHKTLKDFQLDYIDMYLIHWPQAFKEGEEFIPTDPVTGKILCSDTGFLKTWKAFENIYRKNLVRCIGISNFNSKQIDRILHCCTVFPQVNQVECHPYLNQQKLRNYCDNNGIAIMSYCPLGGPRTNIKPGDPDVLNDSRIKEIATRYGKTSGQILLRYNFQLGSIVIPKSANKTRLVENINIFDFHLAPEDMSYINSFDCNGRVCRFDEIKDHSDYPFKPEIEF